MISRQHAYNIVRKLYPFYGVENIEPCFTDWRRFTEDHGADSDMGYMFIGTLVYWQNVMLYQYKFGVGLEAVTLLTENNIVKQQEMVFTCWQNVGDYNLGFEFIGWKVKLAQPRFSIFTMRVPSTTDRNIGNFNMYDSFSGLPVTSNIIHLSGTDYGIAGLSAGQSGTYQMYLGKFLFSIVPTEGIKAASLKVTTSQGSRSVSLSANDNWIQIDDPLVVNEAGFTVEIIDDTL